MACSGYVRRLLQEYSNGLVFSCIDDTAVNLVLAGRLSMGCVVLYQVDHDSSGDVPMFVNHDQQRRYANLHDR